MGESIFKRKIEKNGEIFFGGRVTGEIFLKIRILLFRIHQKTFTELEVMNNYSKR